MIKLIIRKKLDKNLQFSTNSEKVYKKNVIRIDVIPLKKLRIAAVIKMLKTLLKTSGSKTARRDPPGLQAIITIA